MILSPVMHLKCTRWYTVLLNYVILKVTALFSRLALSAYEGTLDGGPDDMTVVDATTLRRQVSFLINTLSLFCGGSTNNGAPRTEQTKYFFVLSLAHQVEPETPTFGGGEQGASKARDDPLLSHCGFLARQHLGVVATLEPTCISAVTVTEERTTPYSTFQMLSTRCTQSLCEGVLYTCVYKACCPQGRYFDFVYLTHVKFYFCTLISSCITFSHVLFLLQIFLLDAKHDSL